jgi:hypothetical protein
MSGRFTKSLPDGKLERLCNVGEQRVTPAGRPLEGVYTDSWFVLSFSTDLQSSGSKPLEEVFDELMGKFEIAGNLFRDLNKMGGTAELHIGVFLDANSGFGLDTNLLKKLTDLNIELGFDLYPPDKK